MPAGTKLAGFLQAGSKCSGLPEKIDEKNIILISKLSIGYPLEPGFNSVHWSLSLKP